MFSRLSIVNDCLIAIGNDLVPDLDLPDVDTEIAMKLLGETTVEILSRGWWFNIEQDWNIALDNKNEIAVPKTVIDFRCSGRSQGLELVKRGGKMYDIRKHTTDLSHLHSPISFEMLIALELEDCPIVAQQYIRSKTITKFLKALGTPEQVREAEKEELTNLALIDRQHLRNKRRNVYEWYRVGAMMGEAGRNSNVGAWQRIGLNPLGGGE